MIKDEQSMITDEEFLKRVNEVIEQYHGQADELYSVLGIVMMGRRYGWRVMRLVSRRGHWKKANEIFGDLRESGIMPFEGDLQTRSWGFVIATKANNYWDMVKGMAKIPERERKKIVVEN